MLIAFIVVVIVDVVGIVFNIRVVVAFCISRRTPADATTAIKPQVQSSRLHRQNVRVVVVSLGIVVPATSNDGTSQT